MSSESVDRCRAATSRDLVVVGEHLFHRDDFLYFPVVAFELGLMDWCTGAVPWLGRIPMCSVVTPGLACE